MSTKRFEKKDVTSVEYDANDAEDDEAFVAEASQGEQVTCLPHYQRKFSSGNNRKIGSREASLPACQADKCSADLTSTKRYYQRHKVCEVHAKATAVTVAGLRQRFCQQCSRFHELREFDESKKSCRSRLAEHNERRRRNTEEYYGETSGRIRQGSSQTRENTCWQPDERGRVQIVIPGNQAIR